MDTTAMQVTRLPKGQPSPMEADCIVILTLDDGRFRMTATALNDGESVALIDYPPLDDVASAEEAGLAWAAEQGVQEVYIAYDPVRISSD